MSLKLLWAAIGAMFLWIAIGRSYDALWLNTNPALEDRRPSQLDNGSAGAPTGNAPGGAQKRMLEPPDASLEGAATQQAVQEHALAPPTPTCKTDWHACKSVEDAMNNFDGVITARVKCKTKADDENQIGDIKWPGLWGLDAFTYYSNDSDFPRSPIIIMITKNAQKQNQFGAYLHVDVACSYDFSANRALGVTFQAP